MNIQKYQKKPRFQSIMDFLKQIKDILQPIYIIFFILYILIVVVIFLWNKFGGERAKEFLTTPFLNPILAFFLFGVAFFLGLIIKRKLKSKATPKFYDRFRIILDNHIRYGHIFYSPLLDYDTAGHPIGIGIAILQKIFGTKKIDKHTTEGMQWHQIHTKLYDKDTTYAERYNIDIIATPIFETNERSEEVSFTIPIFYSEIGLYCKKICKEGLELSDDDKLDLLTAVDRLKKYLGEKKEPTFKAIKGEISDKLIRKHFGELLPHKWEPFGTDQMKISQLIDAIDANQSDIAFVETFQAGQHPVVKAGNVVNILSKQKGIWYPVAFALRKEDYVLRRYINLKLLELDLCDGSDDDKANNRSGILWLIKNELEELQKQNKISQFFSSSDSNDDKLKKVRQYFIREFG